MSLRVLIADEPERGRRIAEILSVLGVEASATQSQEDLWRVASQREAELFLIGKGNVDNRLLKAICSARETFPAAVLDAEPACGYNLALDHAPPETWPSILAGVVLRRARAERLRRQAGDVAHWATQTHSLNRELKRANQRLNTVYESTRRLLNTSDEERVMTEILQTAARYTGGKPAVLMTGRRSGLAPRMALGVAPERLARGVLPCSPTAWQGLRPFDTFMAEYAVEQGLAEILETRDFYYLPLGAQGRAHSLLAVAGSPQEGDRTALRAFLPVAGAALRNVRRMRELRMLAERDSLTGLLNRGAMQRLLRIELKRHQRGGRPLSMVMFDIDHFKAVNDTHGHPAGDKVLKAVSDALQRTTRETDHVARYGGEEFVLILGDTPREGAEAKVADVLQQIRELKTGVGTITLSAGIAVYPEDGHAPASLLEAADRALYAAKNGGRDRAITYAEWLEQTLEESERGKG